MRSEQRHWALAMAAFERSETNLRISSQVSRWYRSGISILSPSLNIFESRETSRFCFIRPAGNPPIVYEQIARGFRLGDSFDLTCRRAVKLGLILQVSEPPRGSVVKNLVQFLGHYQLRDGLFIR